MDGHDALTYYCLDLDCPFFSERVQITPYSYESVDPGPYNHAKSGFADYLGEQHVVDSDFELYKSFFENTRPVDGRAPVWQILTVYSYEPDFGMDGGLILSPLQKLMGSSQAWRHEEFRLGLRFGRVTDMVTYFDRLSKIAFGRGDRYWGFRFAARAIHYLQDSGTPYHVSPGTVGNILKIPLAYRRQFRKISNYHRFHDRYMGYRLWRGYEPFRLAIESKRPSEISEPDRLVEVARKSGLKLLPGLQKSIEEITKRTLEREEAPVMNATYFDRIAKESDTTELDGITLSFLDSMASLIRAYLLILEKNSRVTNG